MKTYQKILIGYLAAIILGTIVPFIAFLCILSYSFITMRRKGELAFLEKDEDKDLKQRMFIAKFNEEISTLGKILEAELAKEERDYQDSKE